MPGRTDEQNGLETLVEALSERLGPSSGIDSDDVDPKELQQLMEEYVSDESEWEKYSLSSPHVPYTRNLVDKGNGKSNLVSLSHRLRQDSTNQYSSYWYGDLARRVLFMSKLSYVA